MNRHYLREDEDFRADFKSSPCTERMQGQAGTSYAAARQSPNPDPAARQASRTGPRPITRLEAAHEHAFRALMRLRDLQSRTGLLADRLVGPPVNTQALRGSAIAGSEEFRPLVRQLEETAGYLHDAIDQIAEAVERLESL